MKALRLLKESTLSLDSIKEPNYIPPGYVKIQIKKIALNHLDLFSFRGMAFARRNFPLIVGVEAAGVVKEIGPGVSTSYLNKGYVIYGAPICGVCNECLNGRENLCMNIPQQYGISGFHSDGFAAEYCVVPTRLLIKIPNNVSLKSAACAPITFATVCHMLFDNAKLKREEEILIHSGGSGIGSTAIKISKFIGAKVYTTVGSDQKVKLAKEIGADYVINYKTNNFLRELKKLTNKKGVDVVFEHIGVDTWSKSISSLKKGGRLVICGSTTGIEASTNLLLLFNNQIKIFGSFGGNFNNIVQSLELMSKYEILPVIDSELDLIDFEKGLERLKNRDVFGKIILNIGE